MLCFCQFGARDVGCFREVAALIHYSDNSPGSNVQNPVKNEAEAVVTDSQGGVAG